MEVVAYNLGMAVLTMLFLVVLVGAVWLACALIWLGFKWHKAITTDDEWFVRRVVMDMIRGETKCYSGDFIPELKRALDAEAAKPPPPTPLKD